MPYRSSSRAVANDNLPTAPVAKMPMGRAIRMVGLALIFDIFKAVFCLLFIIIPLMAGVAAAAVVNAHGETAKTILSAIPLFGPVVNFIPTATIAKAVGSAVAVVTLIFTGPELAAAGEVMADAVSTMAMLVFFYWFLWCGISMWNGKRAVYRMMINGAGSIADVIPIVNIGPWTTLMVGGMAWHVWKEDKEARQEYEKEVARIQNEEQVRMQELEQREMLMQAARIANDNEEQARREEEEAEAAAAVRPVTANVIDFNAYRQARSAMPAYPYTEEVPA